MRLIVIALITLCGAASAEGPWTATEANAADAQAAIQFCHRYAFGWLNQADPETGLLPRRVDGQMFWNTRDCAADNYPFLVLTAEVTDNYYLKRAVRHMLEQEIRLTTRVDGLPDTYDFVTRGFAEAAVQWDAILFGASEYVKDGLMPITEWMGPTPWEERMLGLLRGVWRHAETESPAGPVPTGNLEVHGELLQSMSRMYWRTGDEAFKTWCYRLADLYLLHDPLTAHDRIRLRDHGCEVLSGLSEAYVIAAHEDPGKREAWRAPLHALLDCILEKAVREDGMMPNGFNPLTGEAVDPGTSDGWGYVYNAYLTVAAVDDEPRYRDAVRHALEHIHAHLDTDWEHGSADGYADSIEGALNMLNRIPVDSAFDWADQSMRLMWAKQQPDGIIEGWYGDGNSARTSIMYALWKTQGIAAAPWREDVRLGAARGEDGTLYVTLGVNHAWRGTLRFDRPRHRDYLNMPDDYPRINQFPEWFTASAEDRFTLQVQGEEPRIVTGEELWSLPLEVAQGGTLRLALKPVAEGESPAPFFAGRAMRYVPGSAEETAAWQAETRAALADVLGVSDQGPGVKLPPVDGHVARESQHVGYRQWQTVIMSTAERQMPVVLSIPDPWPASPAPAVVCVHGHGGNRFSVYEEGIYRGFAGELARRGYVCISVDVGQHAVYEPGRTLLGERLNDLMRCVDYLAARRDVDPERIGCAGLSLGGEMCMWLAALDPRVRATVSAGFLTKMDQLERNHCLCWKEAGLRALVDFPDIYGLIAPRALQCQNGKQEPPTQFPPSLAAQAMAEVAPVYAALGAEDRAALHVHDGGHEIDLDALVAFLDAHLR